jgi:hypothetical protein
MAEDKERAKLMEALKQATKELKAAEQYLDEGGYDPKTKDLDENLQNLRAAALKHRKNLEGYDRQQRIKALGKVKSVRAGVTEDGTVGQILDVEFESGTVTEIDIPIESATVYIGGEEHALEDRDLLFNDLGETFQVRLPTEDGWRWFTFSKFNEEED